LSDKLKWILREEVVARTRHFPSIGLEELIKIVETLIGIVAVLADTHTEHLLNTKPEAFRSANE
jgi:hypothetical protein